MNTKKEIVKFLEELAMSVQGKLKAEEHKRKELDKQIIPHEVWRSLKTEFDLIIEHTTGQLYEINYILDTITRDKRKKD